MQFYIRKESGKPWQRNVSISLLHFLRDSFIFILPIKSIPQFIVKIMYGVKPKFIFFVHPRRTEDIYIAFPPAVLIRRYFGKRLFRMIISLFSPVVLSTVKTSQGIDGLIVTGPILPDVFFEDRKYALKQAIKGLFFASKLVQRDAVFGLGALWPMVTRRGIALERYSKPRDIRITNGHSGTIISLILSIEKIAELSDIPLDKLKMAILGVGKMGENLARAFYGKVATITLLDINAKRLSLVETKLRNIMCNTDVQSYANCNDFGGIRNILENNHIAVCTTSNLKRILRPQDIPANTVIIDDSRPEGIPRNLDDNRIVIEGGLLRIKELVHSYDFGFGIDENVFGCLAESFLLAADSSKVLTATLGGVDFENLYKMMDFCKKLNVTVGDFKCCDRIIEKHKISETLKKKQNLASTIPFKNICWIIKVDELLNLKD